MPRSLLSALALAAVAAHVSGQEPSPGKTETPPVFEAGTELVRLDLVVRDEDGDLIRDLRAEEIRIFEDGQPVTLASLRLVDAAGHGPLRATAIPVVGEAAAPAPASAAPAPGDGPSLTSVVLLLFDTLQGRSAQAAQKAALEFVGRSFPENTWFGVFKATRVGLVTVHPFTEEPRSLESAIKAATSGADVRYDQTIDLTADTQAQPYGPGSTGDPAAAAMAAVLSDMRYFESLLMREERGRSSLYPLLTLARSLRGVQGRKTLLHFSQGIEVTPDIDHLLLSAVSEANRSNLAIYTFDARGLFEEDPYAGVKTALRSTIPAEAFMGPADLASMQQGGGVRGGVSKLEIRRPEVGLGALRLNVQENLRELAEGTSGFLVANNNDLRPGLNRVGRDLRTFYEIAYRPPDPEADGKFRRIEVEVARDDVEIRVRKGYYALPPGVPVIHPWEVSLAQALDDDVLPRHLPVRAGTVRLAPDLRASRAVVLVEVPLGELEARVTPETGLWSAHVSMVAFVKDAEGRAVARLSQDWPLEGHGPSSGLRGRNVMLKRTLDLPPGRYTLESAAQDRHSGRLGARRVPFVVPEASSELSLGSVAVVRFQPAPPDVRDPGDPLLIHQPGAESASVRALPVLGAPISVEAGQVGVLASVRPGRDAGPVSVTVEFRRGGQVLAQASPEIPRPDPTGHITLAHSFALPSTEPGRYQVHVHVQQGQERASEATSFRLARADPFGILPGAVAANGSPR